MKKLSEVLVEIANPTSYSELYMEGAYPWAADSLGILLDSDEIEDDQLPPFALANHLKRTLGYDEIQGVITNAKLQKQNVTADELVQAFNFYYRNDAFIDFSSL